MNPHNYSIVVSLKDIDGDSVYESRVLEFPDVRVYGDSFEDAYTQAASVIEDLTDLATELGHEVPQPIEEETAVYSGKITFRMGRSLHRKIGEAAKRDGISQNQLLCNLVASAVSEQDLANKVIREIELLKNVLRFRSLTEATAAATAVFSEVSGQSEAQIQVVTIPDVFSDVTSGGAYGVGSYGPEIEIEGSAPFELVIGNSKF